MEINMVTEIADDQLVGWAFWQYKTFGNEFKPELDGEAGEPKEGEEGEEGA
jgi:hypothetical protein